MLLGLWGFGAFRASGSWDCLGDFGGLGFQGFGVLGNWGFGFFGLRA